MTSDDDSNKNPAAAIEATAPSTSAVDAMAAAPVAPGMTPAAAAQPVPAAPTPAAKPAAPPPPPAPPFVAQPSLPFSMITAPETTAPADAASAKAAAEKQFAGELEGDFETLLVRVRMAPPRAGMIGRLTRPLLRWARSLFATQATELTQVERRVGFDGFTSYLHDEKTERDRRYGTVYTVSEQGNAYLVRLEMPRRTPKSALKETWKLPDEMPDYDYTLSLANGVLSIRAGLHGESLRRVAYVSPSFPSAFMTRIEFACAVDGFKHRMRDKVLEIIIFKQDGDGLKHAA